MNGYIQADILGKVRGLKFGAPAAHQIFMEAAKLNKQLGANVDIVLVPVIIYWGLWNNCYNKKQDPDFTFEDVCDWVDSNLDKTELVASIVNTFLTSSVMADNAATDAKPSEKKSTTLKPRKAGKN